MSTEMLWSERQEVPTGMKQDTVRLYLCEVGTDKTAEIRHK